MIIRRQEFCFKPLITACIHVIALTDNFFFFYRAKFSVGLQLLC